MIDADPNLLSNTLMASKIGVNFYTQLIPRKVEQELLIEEH